MLLEGKERVQSLAVAIVAIARARRSALLNPADLWDLVKLHCPREHKGFWSGPYASAPAVVGLLQVEGFERVRESIPRYPWDIADGSEVGELRRLIEAQGVLFWDREPDRCWRIVDRLWLTAHRDIWHHLHRQWLGGFTCRFCRMVENPSLHDELKSAVPLQGLVHERCLPYFVEWHAIAAQYSSEEEAAAADAAAGRESRYAKVEKPAQLEAAIIDG